MKKAFLLLIVTALLAPTAFAGWNDEEDDRRYKVVINHEEQYSLLFADREVPPGWKATGQEGSKKECLAYIEEVWTDMRPLSWRKHEAWEGFDEPRNDQRYKVVINHEEQYSLWFADRPAPKGWKDADFAGSKKECLDHIEEVWTDMRPLSFRKRW